MTSRGGRIAVVVALALLAAAIGASPIAAAGGRRSVLQAQSGGRIVVAGEFNPAAGLQHWLVCCTVAWTQAIVDPLLPDAYTLAPDFSFVPEVIEGEAVVTTDPFTVTYTIKKEAIWNDGRPVSAGDFVFTWRAYTNRDNFVATRDGYELITSASVSDPKTVTFEFRKPYPDYKRLFEDVFPRHVLRDKNFNRAWSRSIPISAGPFEFGEWEQGSHITLVRNDDYWGDHLAYLDEVEFRFIRDVPRQIDVFAAGEVDVIYSSLHPRLAEVRSFPETEVQSSPGTLMEHVAIQSKDRRILRKPFIRRAVALALDGEAIVEQAIRPIDPDAAVLDNLLLLTNEPGYEPHFDAYRFDPDQAQRILEDHGCTRNDDGVYACNGHRLVLEYITTRPNPIRRKVAEMISSQLDAVGIAVEVERLSPVIAFGTRILVAGDFDLFNFAWFAGPTQLDREIWRCAGSQNFTNYCNEDVGALLKEAGSELDQTRRDGLVNAADAVMARDVASLPLYQRPTFLAYSTRVQGLIDNPMPDELTWNIGDWWLSP